MTLRDATPQDSDAVLRLNAQSVRFLSPLTPERLAWLHGQACYHRVIEREGDVQAFLLGFREGSGYDSVNYRWFAQRYDRFFYVDRVVVAAHAQGRGLGRELYADAFAWAAAQRLPRMTCEIDAQPPNPVSELFHDGFGFREVGRQVVTYGGGKTVSMRAVELAGATAR
jgi:predicted GNAT superfamily acetyltransferase